MPYPSTATPPALVGNAASDNGFRFHYGGKEYLINLAAFGDPGTAGNWHAQVSSDAGQTWTEIIGPARPFTLGSLNQGFPPAFTVLLDGSSAIVCAINGVKQGSLNYWTNFTISKVVFDLNTDTWGSLTTSAIVPFIGLMDYDTQTVGAGGFNHANSVAIHGMVRGAGDYILFVSGTEAGAEPSQKARCSIVTWDGSTFGAEIQLPAQAAGNYYFPIGCTYDSVNAREYYLYTQQVFPNQSTPKIVLVSRDSASGTFDTPQTVINNAVLDGSLWFAGANNPSGVSAPIIYANGASRFVAFLTAVSDAGGTNAKVELFYAPVGANPVFAAPSLITTIASPSQWTNGPFRAQMFSLATNNNTLLASWVYWDGSSSTPTTGYYYSKSDVSPFAWSAPVNLIPIGDGSGTPPLFIAYQVVAGTITGGYGIAGFSVRTDLGAYNTQFAIVADAAALSISGEPPDGVVGVVYRSFDFTATGGTAPYTFSTPDATLLPPGLTLSSGGTLSGTPSQTGTFTFTVTVTDADSNTASETVTVVITAFAILLYGWKLYPEQPCGEPEEIEECPHVERAM